MPKAEKAGFPTYWTTFGQGPRNGLMIHCSLGHSGNWGGMAAHLSGAFRLTAFDMPGHGRSALWDGRGEYQRVTSDIAAAFCEAPPEGSMDGPVDVFGHSFGATVALRLAVERPELVRSLTLIEPVFFAVATTDRPDKIPAFEAEMQEFTTAMIAGDMPAAAKAFIRVWGNGPPWKTLSAVQQNLLASQMHLIAAKASALYDDAGGMLESGALTRIQQPVLLIEGNRSSPIIPAITEGLAARLPNAERSLIAGAGHMLPITHSGQVSTEVLRFIRRV